MADNSQINIPTTSGDIIATDDILGVKHQLVKIEFGAADTATQVSSTNPLPITTTGEAVVSVVNSTIVTLAANGTFTGTSEDVTVYAGITVSLISNVASATDGLQLQQSSDGTNWDWVDVYSIPAATGKTFGAHILGKFFRVVYTNGATIQASFRLQTIYHKFQQPTSTVRPQDGRANDNDFSEELSFLMGYNGTSWDRLRSTIANGLLVDQSDRAARLLGVLSNGNNSIGNINELRASNLAVTVTAATGVAATLTIPAVASQFHYITSIEIRLYSTAARTGSATPILVTTTNISGTPSFTFDTAGAIGTSVVQNPLVMVTPIKSSVVNTATTIVAPIVTGGIWRITATYFTGT